MEIKSSSKRGTKPKNKNKNPKQPLKVVYISNPMKVTTSASGFRALVQRLTGKGAVWPVDLESPAAYDLSGSQTLPNDHNGTMGSNNVSIISDESNDVKASGVESPTPNPSPDTSAASDDLYFQPLDHDHDGVLLFDRDLPVFNDEDFAYLIQSDGLGLFS